MPKFNVILGQTVFEHYDIEVEADNESDAADMAQELFSADRSAFEPAVDRDTSDPLTLVDVHAL